MPRQVKSVAPPPHAEPYVYSSDEDAPRATGKQAPGGRKGLATDPEKGPYDAAVQLEDGGAYQWKERDEGELPWKKAYLPERMPGDHSKHVTFIPDEGVDPEHHLDMGGDFLNPRSKSKRELVRMIHNHWVFKASYYILAQQTLVRIRAGPTTTRIQHMLGRLQMAIDRERKFQNSEVRRSDMGDDVVLDKQIHTVAELRKARYHLRPHIEKWEYKGLVAQIEAVLRDFPEASPDDLAEWRSAHTHTDKYTHVTATYTSTELPKTSCVVMKRLFFAKRLLMRAAERHLKMSPGSADIGQLHALRSYSKHGDDMDHALSKYRNELETLFPREERGERHAHAHAGHAPAQAHHAGPGHAPAKKHHAGPGPVKKKKKRTKTGRKGRAAASVPAPP